VNCAWGEEATFKVGNRVMLSTLHHMQEYKAKGEKHVTKFLSHFDGPYTVTDVHPETSNYMLHMSNSCVFLTFHASELKAFVANDVTLFPMRELAKLGPILMADGLEEYFMEEIQDVCRWGRRWQFLVRWLGYRPEHDEWLTMAELEDCEALDKWYTGGGDGLAQS
jgi:hypothetical protein